MAAGVTRDDDALRRGVRDWVTHQRPQHPDIVVDDLTRPAAGWSNETVIVSISWGGDAGRVSERFVIRLPPRLASFPAYELHDQGRVLAALAHSGVAVPLVIAVEDDIAWLGAPFLVMSFVEGRPGGEIPALDPWLSAVTPDRQRAVHEGFLGALAGVHRLDWQSCALDGSLRVGVRNELDYWARYVKWAATPDAPPRALVSALDWCARTAPPGTGSMSLLWGDARIGNVMYASDGGVVGLLDWELATIGPAEMDLGWYLVLDELTTHFVRASVPGFLGREAAIEYYERALGRPVVHLAWHEVFALVRSVAISDRQARIAAAAGTRYPGIAGDDNPMLRHLDARIASFNG